MNAKWILTLLCGVLLRRSAVNIMNDTDINEIVFNNGKWFELIEGNGVHSSFQLIDGLPRQQCDRAAFP